MNQTMKRVILTSSTLLLPLIGLSVGTLADSQASRKEAEYAVEVRRSLKQVINWNNKAFGQMMKSREVDLSIIELNANRITQLAAMIPDAFALDTSGFENLDTRASSRIWSNKEDFDQMAQQLVKAAESLANVARSGDKKAALKTLPSLGKTACSKCHDAYRPKTN